jgi:hypothetical protein
MINWSFRQYSSGVSYGLPDIIFDTTLFLPFQWFDLETNIEIR